MPTHEYKKLTDAKKKQTQMKRQYGYTPSVMEVKGHGRHFFAVSEPEGLTRIDKKQRKQTFDPFSIF